LEDIRTAVAKDLLEKINGVLIGDTDRDICAIDRDLVIGKYHATTRIRSRSRIRGRDLGRD